MHTSQRTSLCVWEKATLAPDVTYGLWMQGFSCDIVSLFVEPQAAWRQDKLIGGKPPVVKELRLVEMRNCNIAARRHRHKHRSRRISIVEKNYKPTYLQSKTGLKNGEWKPTNPSRSTSYSLNEEKRAPRSIWTMCNSPKKKMSSISGYTLTGDLPGTNIFLRNGNN
jgi:hypothetical protein